MASATTTQKENVAVSVPVARVKLGKLLDRMGEEGRSLVSIRDYVKLAAPEPEILRVLGEISERNGTDKLTTRQVDQIIKTARAERKRR
jgi:hypothetical protein